VARASAGWAIPDAALAYFSLGRAPVNKPSNMSLATTTSHQTQALGNGVCGSPLDKLLILCVLTSASASTQTTILPTARTTLSMARWGSIPKAFGRVHPRFYTPIFSTRLMGGLSIVWTVCLLAFNRNPNVSVTPSRDVAFRVFLLRLHGAGLRGLLPTRRVQERPELLVRGPDPVGRRRDDGCVGVRAYSYYSTARQQLQGASRHPDADPGRRRRADPGHRPDVRFVAVFTSYFRRRWWEAADSAVLESERRHEPEPLLQGEPPEINRH
jgi:hypothetical protein